MTPYLLAAVVLVGIVGALNLVLTFGVIRRLREHDKSLAAHSTAGSANLRLSPDGRIPDFTAITVDGDPFTRAQLTGRNAVGFFSTTCAACLERLPEFVEYARTFPGGRDRVLVVVVAEQPDEASVNLIAQARPVARVVMERYDGPIAAAFAVGAFPTLALVDDDTVVADGSTLQALSAATRV
ncbi:TlpA disulfide reductase family protein [Streptosporangium sp. NPDC023615]|uniref:TlpA disulfide reductase family protein n=1 Tax=Streptosporangium sp. NPDC023615 TaxID=3154794 RepID=UPI00342566FD